MATVQNLIDQLNKIDDKEQSIMFQYYLAEHFDLDGETPTSEQFDQTADDLDDESLWTEAQETINDYLCGIMTNDKENN
jgi:hypothetical protein